MLENPLLSRGEQTKELEAGVHAQRRAERDLRGELFAKADGVRNRKTSLADRARAAAEEKRKQQVAVWTAVLSTRLAWVGGPVRV